MKTLSIMRMRPGFDQQAKALELFAKHGPAAGTEFVLGSTNSQIYVTLTDVSGGPDLTSIATFAPYFDIETIPVVELDDVWMTAMSAAIERQR